MKNRGSGVLLHITSLPSPYGIGDLGPWAYRIADALAEAKQKYWQVLPLNPTDPGSGNSPYSSPSAFAGNTLLISPELLVESGLVTKEDLAAIPSLPQEHCNFISVIPYKTRLFQRAYERFRANKNEKTAFDEFCANQGAWLDDFALFMVIKNHHHGKAWVDWEKDLRDRKPENLARVSNEKGIKLIGDIPIYVNHDSVDVWTHPHLFKLNDEKRPSFVAGVPPDYFSQTGQLWGNPIYRWDILRQTGYSWWFERIGHNLQILDILRIDHFRGFIAYWEVPATEKTAIQGQWVEAPAHDFFGSLLQMFPAEALIAEDLGLITQDVKNVMNRFGLPGMRILQFAFDGDLATHPFLPHTYVPNCIAYTGTHDNNTITGWFKNEATPETQQRLFRYLGRHVSESELPKELIRILMMSIANTVIIPMQDILGLGEEARMNRPSTAHGNWEWRFFPDQFTPSHQELLLELTTIYGRALS
jgi:4-alpha-glucanotransferase